MGHGRQPHPPRAPARGRYEEARGGRLKAYTGRYWVNGTEIDYRDDTGFSADGRFEGDVLHHGGYLFYREGSEAHQAAAQPQFSA